MKYALLCGYYGMGNGGDEALLATLLQLLPSDITPIVLSGNPSGTKKLHQVEAIDRYNLLAILDAMHRSQLFIWGGGSLLQDVTSWRNPIYYGSLILLAKRLGLTTIAWAQGIGPLQRSFSQWFGQKVIKNCDRISVRDQKSALLLQQWGVSTLLAPDPVWILETDRAAPIWQLPAPRVAVVLRPHPQLSDQKLAILLKALQSFQRATDTHILLIPMHSHQDLPIAEFFHRALSSTSTIVNVDHPRSLKGLFQGVEMTISMRLHGLIMAAATQSRCWAISYDPKVSQLMAELRLPGWEVGEIPDQPDRICQDWLDFFANGDPLSAEEIQSLQDRALMHRSLLV